MPYDNNKQAIIDKRRLLVARASLHGGSMREIAEALQKQGEFNPDTNLPWTYRTVARDMLVIRKQWREDAKREIAEYTAEQIAELREVRRKAWTLVRLDTVLRSLAQEAKLLGLDAPDKLSVSGQQEVMVNIFCHEGNIQHQSPPNAPEASGDIL